MAFSCIIFIFAPLITTKIINEYALYYRHFPLLFLSVLLFAKRPKALSDKVLAIWLVCIGIYLLNYYLHYLGYWEKYPHLVGATHPFPLLFAPFVYLYVLVCSREDQHFHWRDSLHFLPFCSPTL